LKRRKEKRYILITKDADVNIFNHVKTYLTTQKERVDAERKHWEDLKLEKERENQKEYTMKFEKKEEKELDIQRYELEIKKYQTEIENLMNFK
jgi:hypothetical protein